jgi:hypothetical protein
MAGKGDKGFSQWLWTTLGAEVDPLAGSSNGGSWILFPLRAVPICSSGCGLASEPGLKQFLWLAVEVDRSAFHQDGGVFQRRL